MTCFCGAPAGVTGLCPTHEAVELDARHAIQLYEEDDLLAYTSRRTATVITVPVFDGDATKYGRAAMQGLTAEISAATEPGRNETLNRCAYRAARLVAGGQVMKRAALAACLASGLACGLPMAEVKGTLRGAFTKGMQDPYIPTGRVA